MLELVSPVRSLNVQRKKSSGCAEFQFLSRGFQFSKNVHAFHDAHQKRRPVEGRIMGYFPRFTRPVNRTRQMPVPFVPNERQACA